MKNITVDDQELLRELVSSEAWKSVIKLMEAAVDRQRDSLLTYNTSNGTEGLIYAKLRLEGAETVLAAIKTAPKALREKK